MAETNTKAWPTCDRCDKPATMAVRDVIESEGYQTGYLVSAPVGFARYGCEAHPVGSVTYRTRYPLHHTESR